MRHLLEPCATAIRSPGFGTLLCAGLLSTTIGAAELPQVIAAGVPNVTPGTSIAALKLGPSFYQPPHMPFVTQDGEQVIPVAIETCTGTEAQAILDNERTYVPGGGFVVTVTGTITISDTPLSPKAKTCLVFAKGAKVVATAGGKASELILIQDTELVSISAAKGETVILDGAGRDVSGVRIQNSGKVHLDNLTVQNCRRAGVDVTGCGADRYAHPVSLTRSRITGSKQGVLVRKSAQFIALDNTVTKNEVAGLDIDSASPIVANTISAGNGVGLVVRSQDATITRNQFVSNKTGVHLEKGCVYSLVYENVVQSNGLGMRVEGKNAAVGWNVFAANEQRLATAGSGNLFQSNEGITANDMGAGAEYFNPPTVANPHKEEIIWKGEKEKAMVRQDISIASGARPMSGTDLTARLDEARKQNPGKVLVVSLNGTFVINSDQAINIPDHTCVLLKGSVVNELSTKQRPFLVAMKGKGCASLSGGSVSSSSAVYEAITGTGAANTILVDAVTVDLNAAHGKVGSKSVNAVSAKQHKGSFILRASTIHNPGSRGIWAHVSDRVHTLANRFYAGGMTIDFDAFCFHSSALFNTVSDGIYHSSIFFEEAVHQNTAFANHCIQGQNASTGISIWCQVVKGATKMNLSACNRIEDDKTKIGGRDGIGGGRPSLGVGGRTPENRTEANFSFNDRIINNQEYRPIYFGPNSKDNYVAQTVLMNSPKGVFHVKEPSNNSVFATPGE